MKNLVILCGGLSSRMGSDKALLKFGETTFIEHLYSQAADYFDRIILSIDTKEHEDVIRKLPLFTGMAEGRSEPDKDRLPETAIDNYEHAGPIGGLLSVFENTDVERFAVISTDVPCADMRALAALYEICTKGSCKLIFKHSHPEPLVAAYDRKVYKALKEAYINGVQKLRLAVPAQYSELVTEEELKCFDPELRDTDLKKAFRNFNTKEELKELYD